MAISAPRDDNRVPTMLGTSNLDGSTVVSIAVNPTNNRLKVSNGISGSSFPSTNAQRDANRVPAIWGVSSADFKTPIPIYVDSSNNLLIDGT